MLPNIIHVSLTELNRLHFSIFFSSFRLLYKFKIVILHFAIIGISTAAKIYHCAFHSSNCRCLVEATVCYGVTFTEKGRRVAPFVAGHFWLWCYILMMTYLTEIIAVARRRSLCLLFIKYQTLLYF